MQVIPDKDFNVFKHKLDAFEVEPSSAVWKGIVSALGDERQKRSFPVSRLMAAAGILIVLSMGLWLFSPKEKIRLHGKADALVAREEPLDHITVKAGPEVETKTAEPAQAAPAKISPLTPVVPPEPAVVVKNEPVKEVFHPAELPPAQIEIAKIDAALPDHEALLPDTEVLAMIPADGHDTAAPAKTYAQHRVKTIGDFVNFVIGKVDSREDKIIEFRNDEDGGSAVSGINLGLLKIKSYK